MDITFRSRGAGYALVLIFMFLPAPATGETTSVSQGVCTTIGEKNCTVNARKRTISILERHLKGKKNAKAVARLIGRPICNRIVNKFVYTPLRPLLNDWQMTLQDRRDAAPLYACKLY